MGDLFPIAIQPDAVRSPHLRLEPVPNDAFAPALNVGTDFVLVLPTTRFEGDGLYLVGDESGTRNLYRATLLLGGKRVSLSRDNPLYGSGQTVDLQPFEGAILDVVVADVRIRAPHLLPAPILYEGARP